MQEKQVTVGHTTHMLDEPFFVMATQNPLEMEGTYPLPEAQLDRFLFKIRVPFPGREELHDILDRTTQGAEPQVRHVLNGPKSWRCATWCAWFRWRRTCRITWCKLVLATHSDGHANALANKYIRYGSSPRGAQALILGGKVRALLNGRFNVSTEDIRALLKPALRHRIILNFEAQADGRAADDLLEEIAGSDKQELKERSLRRRGLVRRMKRRPRSRSHLTLSHGFSAVTRSRFPEDSRRNHAVVPRGPDRPHRGRPSLAQPRPRNGIRRLPPLHFRRRSALS